MTAAATLYQQEKAKRRDFYLSDRPQRKLLPDPVPRMERNAEWKRQYESGLSTTEIAMRWEMARGEKCYPELVRRTLVILGVTMRPRGTRTAGRRSLVARVRELEERVAELLKAREAA